LILYELFHPKHLLLGFSESLLKFFNFLLILIYSKLSFLFFSSTTLCIMFAWTFILIHTIAARNTLFFMSMMWLFSLFLLLWLLKLVFKYLFPLFTSGNHFVLFFDLFFMVFALFHNIRLHFFNLFLHLFKSSLYCFFIRTISRSCFYNLLKFFESFNGFILITHKE